MKANIKYILILIRPHQYVKNLFIFMPLFFSGKITDRFLLLNAFMAFIAFSLSASALYILNDYKDIEEDRQHPKKRYRPLASGAVSKTIAIPLMLCLLFAGIFMMAAFSIQAFFFLIGYIALNISYSFSLKHIAILDVTSISIGFVFRLFVGSYTTAVPLSMWIIIMTFLLALFLALAKRRDDVLLLMNTGIKNRKVADGYNIKLIDGTMMIMASVVIVSYILYTTSPSVIQRMQNEYLYLTVLFVITGIMRYLQITFIEENSGSPTMVVLKDKFLQINICSWIMSFVWIIYF